MLAEFDLIRRFFMSPQEAQATNGVALGCGDDATLLMPQVGQELAVSVDTSVVNVHFPHDAPAQAVGHRALAVALSDLAAMGAVSRWCLMALTLDQRAFEDDGHAEQWLSLSDVGAFFIQALLDDAGDARTHFGDADRFHPARQFEDIVDIRLRDGDGADRDCLALRRLIG